MRNILVVDGSRISCDVLKTIIERNVNHNVVVAHSKKEALEKLIEYKGKFSVALVHLEISDAPNGEIVDFIKKFNIIVVVLTDAIFDSFMANEARIEKYIESKRVK